jgi:predicted nuclease of predicted toxin-antitoxin system
MKIYLDEDIASALLAQLLRRAGHDLQTPADVNLGGEHDPVVLRHAVREGRVLLSRNHADFEELHLLILEAGGRHPGILVERFDDDPSHRMTPREIVRAARNIEASGLVLANEYQVLNLWQ